MAFEKVQRRVYSRRPLNVPLDLIALRSGVPESLPGRCTDISESGVGAVVAGELATGQQVAIELRLPDVGVPVLARALVRHESQLRCGLEFVGLSVEHREMIRYWVDRSAPALESNQEPGITDAEAPVVAAKPAVQRWRRIRIGRREIVVLITGILVLAGLAWWQWQRSWDELEKRGPVRMSRLRTVPAVRPGLGRA